MRLLRGLPVSGPALGASTSVAELIARCLQARGIDRVFGLQGGHIQPVWDHLFRLGVQIIDVRDEGAAVHMAHAHAELTQTVGVALATAGPGVTNTVTAMANADISRVPVLLFGGCPPRMQANMGPLQDQPHVDILRPVTRTSRTARVADQVLRELDEALSRAVGDLGEPGPVYLEVPTDVLREEIPAAVVLDEWMRPAPPRILVPDSGAVQVATDALWSAKRPLVITGRGSRGAGTELIRLLDASGAIYLDTQESRGLVPPEHPSVVGAVRGRAMVEADLVLVVGRKLDYQLGYGSPAVFPEARIVRISDTPGELIDNRRGDPEVLGTPALVLQSMVEVAGNRKPAVAVSWANGMRDLHRKRSAPRPIQDTADGRIHPEAIFAAIQEVADSDCIGVADGGDILSFARVGLTTSTYMDSGALGCLGVGVPFAVAAALAFPDRQVISVNGDGAFGFNVMEIDTAVRHGARAVFVVSNNAAWNIERHDQETNYGGRVVGTLLRDSDYAGLGRSLGAHAERVEDADQIVDALKRAFKNAPSVVDIVTSQDAVSSDATKGLGFVPDRQALLGWDEAERKRRGEG